MEGIGGHGGTQHFRVDGRATLHGVFGRLEYEDARALAEEEAVPVAVEWP